MGSTQHIAWQTPVHASGHDRHGLGLIDEPTCLRLLSQERLGRLGISVRSLPVILPVNYVVVGDGILFRSEDGEKVRAAHAGAVACFEVDRFDRMEHTGWTVTATGRLEVVSTSEEAELGELHLVPWALRQDTSLIRLPVELVSGRVIEHH